MNAVAQPALNTSSRLSRRSLDGLEEDIIRLSQHINASEYEFLVLLREFDLRQGWKAYHFNNCAEWLNRKCGIAPGTAREKLRVASALFDLPGVARAFQRGDLFYSKARALSRVATPRNEAHLLDFALGANAATVDRHCLELRSVQREVSTGDINRLHDRRCLCCSPHNDGSGTLSIELPKAQADLVMKARELADSRREYPDAGYFSDGESKCSMSELDGDAPRGASARRLCCDGGIVPLVRDAEGKPTGLGRKHRVVNPQLRRAAISEAPARACTPG